MGEGRKFEVLRTAKQGVSIAALLLIFMLLGAWVLDPNDRETLTQALNTPRKLLKKERLGNPFALLPLLAVAAVVITQGALAKLFKLKAYVHAILDLLNILICTVSLAIVLSPSFQALIFKGLIDVDTLKQEESLEIDHESFCNEIREHTKNGTETSNSKICFKDDGEEKVGMCKKEDSAFRSLQEFFENEAEKEVAVDDCIEFRIRYAKKPSFSFAKKVTYGLIFTCLAVNLIVTVVQICLESDAAHIDY